MKYARSFIGAFLLAVSFPEALLADEPLAQGKGHSRVQELMKRVRETNGGQPVPASKDRKADTFLDGYLKLEFRGALGPADSFSEPTVRDRGLVEVYGGEVDEKLDRMAKLIASQCPEPLRLDKAAAQLLRKFDSGYGKQRFLLHEGKSEKDLGPEIRRMALLVFMAKEWTELRRVDDKKLALRAFKNEFNENFAGILEWDESPVVKGIEKKEGKKSLDTYRDFINDMDTVTKALDNEPTSTQTKNAPQAIHDLKRLLSRVKPAACPLNDEMKGLLAKRLSAILQDVDWSDANRGAILDFILGTEPKPEADFHFKGKQLELDAEHLELLIPELQKGKGSYLKRESREVENFLYDSIKKMFEESRKTPNDELGF